MKNKIIAVLIIIAVLLSSVVIFQFCRTWLGERGRVDDVVINIGESAKFSQKEIQAAMDLVIKKFPDFIDCELTELWYDEEKSEQEITRGYMVSGRGSNNGIQKENAIIIYSNFTTGAKSADEGFNPNSRYTNWMWILIRPNEHASWTIDDWGY